MAYKFQLGPAVMSGSLTQEGGLIIKDDDGSQRLSVDRDSGQISGSGGMQIAGATELGNNLAVSGTVKLDGVADATIDLAADSMYFLDSDGLMKREALSDYAVAIAGPGIGSVGGGIEVNVDDSSIEISSDTLQVKALGITDAMLAGSISDAKLAEDYVQVGEFTGSFNDVLATKDTDDLAEGASNLYFTDARARASVSVTDAGGDGSLAYDSSTGVITYTGPSAAEVRAHFSGGEMIDLASGVISINGTAFSGSWDAVLATKDTDDLAEGNNLYFTDARARAAISVTDAGGDGSLAYDNSTGVITYTGPSASEVRAHFSVADTDSMDMSYDAVNGEFSADLKLNSGDGQNSFEIVSGGLRLKADVAGSGLSLSGGVLSVDGGAQNAIGDAAGNLAVGFNYGSADLTADRTWTLPASPAAGDVVHVKAPLVGSNKIIVAAGAGDSIDGVAQIEIESDQGAVSLMAISDGAWKIF